MSEVPEAIQALEIQEDGYHRCETCHATVDIPCDLYLRLDSGIFQGGLEAKQVDLNDPWHVAVYWALLGRFASCVCTDWYVSLRFESMGDGPEFRVGKKIESGDCDYWWYHHFDGDDIEPYFDQTDPYNLVYRVVVVVTAIDKCYKRPVGITGFCDLGLIEFYKGKTA